MHTIPSILKELGGIPAVTALLSERVATERPLTEVAVVGWRDRRRIPAPYLGAVAALCEERGIDLTHADLIRLGGGEPLNGERPAA